MTSPTLGDRILTMDQDKLLREQLVNFLKGGHAHMDLDEAVKDYPAIDINKKFPNGTYSAGDLLEHIRRTQADILNFIINPKYKDLQWPRDYWPDPKQKATEKDWKKTVSDFKKDLGQLVDIINDPNTNLNAKIKWGSGQTILREVLLVIDHNSYHFGEFAIMRQAMNNW